MCSNNYNCSKCTIVWTKGCELTSQKIKKEKIPTWKKLLLEEDFEYKPSKKEFLNNGLIVEKDPERFIKILEEIKGIISH